MPDERGADARPGSLLAVDAGQTGVRLRRVEHGATRAETEVPGVYTDAPLVPQLAALARAHVETHGPVDVVAVGTTGLTGPEADPASLLGALREAGVRTVHLAHDSVTSYLGALGDVRGAVVAAGTGVVTLAVGASEVARVDGWGHIMGDAGSGYWIGRAALDAVMRAHDGRGPATALRAVVARDFPDLEDAYVALQADADRVRRVAGYARAVAALAATDSVAAGICAAAADELALSVATGLRRVGEGERPDPLVCGIGGVFAGAAVADAFADHLRAIWPEVRLVSARGAGIDGAAALPAVAPDSALHAHIATASRG